MSIKIKNMKSSKNTSDKDVLKSSLNNYKYFKSNDLESTRIVSRDISYA